MFKEKKPKVKVELSADDKPYVFCFEIQKNQDNWTFEIKIPPVWLHKHSLMIHFHKGENDKKFVTAAQNVQNEEEARKMLELWAAGTAYTIKTGEDVATLFPERKIVPEKFRDVLYLLKAEHGVRIKSVEFYAQ